MDAVGWLAIIGAYLAAIYVCFQKGKRQLGWVGITGLIPFLTPVLGWFPVVGALRIATPDSPWARRHYLPAQMHLATQRYPTIETPLEARQLPASTNPAGAQREPGSIPVSAEISASQAIVEFLLTAIDENVIDEATFERLHALRRRQFAGPTASADAPSSTIPVTAPPPVPSPQRTPTPAETTQPTDKPAGPIADHDPQPPPPPADTKAAPAEPRPTAPTSWPQPSRPAAASTEALRSAPRPTITTARPKPSEPVVVTPSKLSQLWDSASSDMAVHGLAYLGVLATLIGTLGFLVFAFVDVDDQVQPFVELFLAAIFFGWAWMLRRQQADRVADGMELIGGIVLPIIWFAGLVDNAPFPPDFQDGPLVAAMTVSSAVMALVYARISARNPKSTLRFLVGPLIWLGAMTLGFAFKTDEPLASVAITRLVPAQPAMAAAAIALTLAFCQRRPTHRLVAPTFAAALVGVPFVYLLTVSLTLTTGWTGSGPILLLGIATMISAELLAVRFEKQQLVAALRPILLAGVILPLLPVWSLGGTGLVAALAYIGLFEWRVRSDLPADTWQLSLIGALAGLAMSLAEPATAVPAFAVGSLWTHYRRAGRSGSDLEGIAFEILGWLTPIGLGYSLYRLTDPTTGWLILAGIVAVVAVLARWRGWDDAFWTVWPSAASWAVAIGAVSTWDDTGLHPLWAATGLALSALVTFIGPRWLEPRLWVASVLASGGIAVALEGLAYRADLRPVVWAISGAIAVGAATVWQNHPAGHLAAVGHVIGLGAVLGIGFGDILNANGSAVAPAVVLAAWTVGWALSAMNSNRDGASMTALLMRTTARVPDLPGRILSVVAPWVAPAVLVGSFPPTVLEAANLWEPFSAHRSWTGVLLGGIAIVYGLAAPLTTHVKPLGRALTTGAIVASVIGVAVAPPDSWPTIAAAGAVIAVAALISGTLRRSGFVWFAWVMSIVMILLLAEQAGVAPNYLHLVSLVWGGVMLVGGLLFDDRRSGRRNVGEGLRTEWIRYPVLLGALVLPISLGQAFGSDTSSLGEWSVGAGLLYLVVAYLMRAGSVSAPGYALISLGTAVLIPWFQIDQPWRLVVLAAPLVLVSWAADRLQTKQVASDAWLGWSLAPLAVAHLIGGLALVLSPGSSPLYATFLAFGLLSLIIAWLRRQRGWLEVGNLLLLVAAGDAGPGWLTLALAGTALRGVLTVRLVEGSRRIVYQLIGTVSAGLAWLALLEWRDYLRLDEVNASVVLFGAIALIVAGLRRARLVEIDTLKYWGGLAMVGVITTTFFAIGVDGVGVQGPWFALGFVLFAAAAGISANDLGSAAPAASIATAALAWGLLAVGMDWEFPLTVKTTVVTFGSLLLASVEWVRYRQRRRDSAQADDHKPALHEPAGMAASFGAVGLISAGIPAAVASDPADMRLWAAASFGLLALGTGRAARPFALDWLRQVSTIADLAAIGVLIAAANSASLGWVTLVLAANALRSAVTIPFVVGYRRVLNQLMGPLSAVLAWVVYVQWRDYLPIDGANASVILFGTATLVVAGLRRVGLVKLDTLRYWGGLAIGAVIATTIFALKGGGPGVEGPWFALGVVACAAAIAISANDLGSAAPAVSVATVGVAWGFLALGMNWEFSVALQATMIVFGSLFIASLEFLRRRGRQSDSGHAADYEPVSFRHPIALTAGLGAAGLVTSSAGTAFVTEPASLGFWSAAGFGLLAIGAGRAARSFALDWFRSVSSVSGLLAATQLGVAAKISEGALAGGIIAIAVVATVGLLWIWKRRPGSVWENALVMLGTLATLEAVAMMANAQSRQLFVAVLLSVGAQATAIGIVRARPDVLSIGPPLIGLAAILMVTESASGSVQWYTIPIGLVILSEVEILRAARSPAEFNGSTVLVLEWAGIAMLAAPPIVEMFAGGIVHGLTAFAVAGGLLLWAIVTRVRRRVVSAASLAVATAVLILFAAAAEQTGESAYFWIVAVGFGFAVMLVAALIEAQRSKKGRIMARVGDLMEDWE